MTDYVLVAGAFHGAWAWDQVGALLTAAGHRVHAVDLTGQGARARLATPATDLSTHIEDVMRVLVEADLHDAILVGHSYAGLVVTGAADRAGDRVRHLVYTDATVPEDGKSAADYAGEAMTRAVIELAGDDWQVANFFPLAKFGPFADADAEAAFDARLVKHPLATFFEPIRLANPPIARRTFVRSTLDPMPLFEAFAQHARTSPDWTYHELATGHDAMLTAPVDLARLLVALSD